MTSHSKIAQFNKVNRALKRRVGNLRNAYTICPREFEGGGHLGDLNVNGKKIRSVLKDWDVGIRSCDLSEVFFFLGC
jgi:hypothetical protein